ncbi:MAG: PEP-CTERM sorting domain-containing protein [Planctomycetaceae bacterium]|nr:PEP-CTERM sorting domain-containing protein [Planctomycetaceae bacterium]
MLRSAFLMMGLIVLTTVSSASAGAVEWAGLLTTKSGAPTGLNLTIPPSVPFSGKFNLAASFADTGVFNGSILFGTQTMNITVGTLQRTPTQLSFNVAQADNDRTISMQFVFTGTFAGWGAGDTAGLDAVVGTLLPTSGPKPIGNVTMLQLSGINVIGTYGGSVQAVPEPSSAIALVGLGLGFGFRYRRKFFAKK